MTLKYAQEIFCPSNLFIATCTKKRQQFEKKTFLYFFKTFTVTDYPCFLFILAFRAKSGTTNNFGNGSSDISY